jgi:thiol-disulfide isomerase/thioredoxin
MTGRSEQAAAGGGPSVTTVLRLAVGAVCLALLAGCGADQVPAPSFDSTVDVDTPALRSVKQEAGVEPCPRLGDGGSSELPALTLPCLGGGPSVDLSGVEGPAVVSVWASWCTPCRRELPLFQRLHEQTRGRLTVLGVDFKDVQPDAAVRLLRKTGATFWQVADPDGDLGAHFRLLGLPGLLLVDADGAVTFLPQRVDSFAQLTSLVAEHTGVEAA